MKNRIFLVLIALALFIVGPVSAKEVNHFYSKAGDHVSIKDTIKADSAVAGNLVDIIGNIDGIGFIAGNNVNIKGESEYIFVAGNKINVNSSIKKSLYAAGSDITISSDSKIERDAFLMANSITLDGTINRDLSLGTNDLVIKSTAKIGGDVSVSAGRITVEDGASIEGTLKYNKDAKSNISDTANIGKIDTYKSNEKEENKTSEIADLLASTINMIVVFVVIAAVLPKTCEKASTLYEEKNGYFKGLGTGLLVLICTPVICLLLLVSSVGISLGFVLLGLYLIGLYLSYVASGFVLGNAIVSKLLNKSMNNYLIGIIGIIVLKLLTIVPVIGSFVSAIAVAIGLSTICRIIVIDDKSDKAKSNDKKIVDAEIIKKDSKKKSSK